LAAFSLVVVRDAPASHAHVSEINGLDALFAANPGLKSLKWVINWKMGKF
jgi:hypothetical protein